MWGHELLIAHTGSLSKEAPQPVSVGNNNNREIFQYFILQWLIVSSKVFASQICQCTSGVGGGDRDRETKNENSDQGCKAVQLK